MGCITDASCSVGRASPSRYLQGTLGKWYKYQWEKPKPLEREQITARLKRVSSSTDLEAGKPKAEHITCAICRSRQGFGFYADREQNLFRGSPGYYSTVVSN